MKLGDQTVTMISSKKMLPDYLQEFLFKILENIKKQASQTEILPEIKTNIDQLSQDAAIQPLLPYLIRTIRENIMFQITNATQLQVVLNIANALFHNPNLETEGYMFHFITIAITIMLSQVIGEDQFDDKSLLRESAADFLGVIIQKYNAKYPNLQLRIADHLITIIFDSAEKRAKPTSQYGAAIGLRSLDPIIIREKLLPHLPQLLSKIKNDLNHIDPIYKMQTSRLYGALYRVVASCLYSNAHITDPVEKDASLTLYNSIVNYFGSDILSYFPNRT